MQKERDNNRISHFLADVQTTLHSKRKNCRTDCLAFIRFSNIFFCHPEMPRHRIAFSTAPPVALFLVTIQAVSPRDFGSPNQ